jgi:hypothetical protein
MGTLNLNAYGVREMEQQEMLGTEGGNIIKAVAQAIASAAKAVYEAVGETFSDMEITVAPW